MKHCVSQRKEPIDFILVMGITVITDTNQLKENVQHFFFLWGENRTQNYWQKYIKLMHSSTVLEFHPLTF